MLDWLPENVSSFGEGVDHLFHLIYYIAVAIFVNFYNNFASVDVDRADRMKG